MNSPPSNRDHGNLQIYYELVPVGAYIKVIAMEARTGIEVSIVGAARAPQADLQRLARTKLIRKLHELGIIQR